MERPITEITRANMIVTAAAYRSMALTLPLWSNVKSGASRAAIARQLPHICSELKALAGKAEAWVRVGLMPTDDEWQSFRRRHERLHAVLDAWHQE
jgi:hypothetical protein